MNPFLKHVRSLVRSHPVENCDCVRSAATTAQFDTWTDAVVLFWRCQTVYARAASESSAHGLRSSPSTCEIGHGAAASDGYSLYAGCGECASSSTESHGTSANYFS